jgi:predicted methyltransferase
LIQEGLKMSGLYAICFRHSAVCAVILAAIGAACLGLPRAVAQGGAPDFAALMAAPDRSDADRQADTRRDPVPFLAFAGLRSGMKVLDMGAGAGYSTELDARAVGPSGVVYGQNPPDFSERGKGAFAARLAKPAMQNSVSVLRPFDDPLPADVHDLDAITFLFFYHDTTYMEVDRAQMDRKLFAALKPGGVLVIADHAAQAGADIAVGKSLHRIDESTVRREVEAAGFKLIAQGDFWRHPEDARDFSTLRPTGPVDEFVLKFQKPM